MPRYKKKPVVIEAFQLNKDMRLKEIPEWAPVRFFYDGDPTVGNLKLVETGAVIGTLEGPMNAAWGDYIIQGVKGEIYSCREDIFLATYEAVD